MNFRNPYLSEVEKINLLQRWILVHSFLYYELDDSIVKDRMFDMDCQQLVKLVEFMKKKGKTKELKRTRFWYAFNDFDGSTGFHLYKRLNEEDKVFIHNQAMIAYDIYKRRNEK